MDLTNLTQLSQILHLKLGLAMFQIEDQPVVSCFLLEVVLLVGAVRNNQQLHYQARKQNTEVQQLLHVK
jgi:hypothetical protein